MNKYIDSYKLRQISFIVILVVLGWNIFTELKNFIPAFLGALMFYVVMRKWMFRMVYVRKWKSARAASLLMLTSFIVIMVPIWMVVRMLSPRVTFAIEHASEIMAKMKPWMGTLQKRTGIELLSAKNIDAISGFMATHIPSVLGATLNTVASIAMMYFMLFFYAYQRPQHGAGNGRFCAYER